MAPVFWGQFQIAAWKEVPGARLVALGDRNYDQAAAIAQKFGIPKVFADAEEMLCSETIDFVDVAAASESHSQLVMIQSTRLTYFYQGRDQRLTDVHGQREFLLRHS